MSDRKQSISITLKEESTSGDKRSVVVLPMSVPIAMEPDVRIAGERYQSIISYYRNKYDESISDIPIGGYFAMAGLYLSYKYLEAEKKGNYKDLLSKLKNLNTKLEEVLYENY